MSTVIARPETAPVAATVAVTVPPVTDKQAAAGSWRKTINQLTAARGGQAVDGDWLQPGDVVTLPAGTVVIAVDKTTIGWDHHYKTGERYAVQSATVTLYVAKESGLREQWTRSFKQANSAIGATTRKRIEALLADRQAPSGPVTVSRWKRSGRHAATPRACGAPGRSGPAPDIWLVADRTRRPNTGSSARTADG